MITKMQAYLMAILNIKNDVLLGHLIINAIQWKIAYIPLLF